MWYAIGILFVVFLVIGLAHSHNNVPIPPKEVPPDPDDYVQRIYPDLDNDRESSRN